MHMLNATVSITMYGFEPSQESASGFVSEETQPGRTEGLGTVVSHDGEQLIVTHNHWHLLNPELELVQFRNAQQQLLATVTGEEFFGLIRYQDQGTMILSQPVFDGSVETVSWSRVESIKKGAVVQVVHRRRDEKGGVSAVSATVEAIEGTDGIATFLLRSLDGHIIVPGDSGGGIWYEGQLVGNMWTTLVVNIKAAEESDGNAMAGKMEANWSQAAVLLSGFQNRMTAEAGPMSQAEESQPAPTMQVPGLPPAESQGIG